MTNPYILFDTRLVARRWVSTSLLRVTLRGAELANIGTTGLDQRFKLIPCDAPVADALLQADNWYGYWRGLADEQRPPVRTYTFVAFRPEVGEVDFDVAIHADTAGPGMDFCANAPLYSRALICGPLGCVPGHDQVGLAWLPDNDRLDRVLIVADETALPAARAILASLHPHVSGVAIIEVPHEGDCARLPRPVDVELHWCVRSRGETALDHLPFPVSSDAPVELTEEPYWYEAEAGSFSGWVAGESHWVAHIRRGAKNAGIPREHMSFMGYWRNDAPGG